MIAPTKPPPGQLDEAAGVAPLQRRPGVQALQLVGPALWEEGREGLEVQPLGEAMSDHDRTEWDATSILKHLSRIKT